MVKPQQPELRRSDRGATSDDALKEQLTAPGVSGADAPRGPVPEDNLPGHHPAHEQDKPTGQDFVAKMHALAQAEDAEESGEDEGPPATRHDEVLDLTDIPEDTVHTGSEPFDETTARGERLAQLAGKPFAAAGAVLGAVRRRLPDRP